MSDPAGVRSGSDVRLWLNRAAAARPACSHYVETLMFREAMGGATIGLHVEQSQPSTARWIGLPFDTDTNTIDNWPQKPTTAWVIEGEHLTGPVTGFVVDEWSESVPWHVPDPVTGEKRLIHENGIAVNANAPSARPPQSILLALSADGQPWDVDRLAAVLDDTRTLARERLVTLEKLPFAGRVLPALYFRDWALQGEPIIDFAKLARLYTQDAAIPFLKGAT